MRTLDIESNRDVNPHLQPTTFAVIGGCKGISMGRFTIYLMGCAEGLPVEIDVPSVREMEPLLSGSRFIAGDLIDVPIGDGLLSTRAALIPISRIRMILEDD